MHDDIYDHDHPENFEIKEGEIVTEIEGLEMFSLKSVGIDIGSSTSHLDFLAHHLTTPGRLSLRQVQGDQPRSALSLPDHADAILVGDQNRYGQGQSIYSPRLRRGGTHTGRCRYRRGHHHWRSAKERKRPADCRILRQVLWKIHLRGCGSQPRGAARGLRLRRGGSIQVRA